MIDFYDDRRFQLLIFLFGIWIAKLAKDNSFFIINIIGMILVVILWIAERTGRYKRKKVQK